jgi:hypothetical protein
MDFDQLLSSASEKVELIAPAFSFNPDLLNKIIAIEERFEIRDRHGYRAGYEGKVRMLIKAHSDHALIVFAGWDPRSGGEWGRGDWSCMELVGILDEMLKSELYKNDPYCIDTSGIKVRVAQDFYDSLGDFEASSLFEEFRGEARVMRTSFLEEESRLAFGYFEGKPFETLMAYLDETVKDKGGVQW